MKVLRITLSANEVLKQKEPEFQKNFTQRLLKSGFDLRDPIIRQERSDVEGCDFIQLKYTLIDTILFDIKADWVKLVDYLKKVLG